MCIYHISRWIIRTIHTFFASALPLTHTFSTATFWKLEGWIQVCRRRRPKGTRYGRRNFWISCRYLLHLTRGKAGKGLIFLLALNSKYIHGAEENHFDKSEWSKLCALWIGCHWEIPPSQTWSLNLISIGVCTCFLLPVGCQTPPGACANWETWSCLFPGGLWRDFIGFYFEFIGYDGQPYGPFTLGACPRNPNPDFFPPTCSRKTTPMIVGFNTSATNHHHLVVIPFWYQVSLQAYL